MIFDLLKRRWLREEYAKYDTRKESRQLKWPESLLIIVDAEKDQDATLFNKWINLLGLNAQNVTIIGRCASTKKSLVTNMELVDSSFLKWNGGISNDEIATLLDKPVDLQLNYFDLEFTLTHYLARRCNGSFRVGYTHHSDTLYDLSLDIPTNEPDLFITETIKYLKILTQK